MQLDESDGDSFYPDSLRDLGIQGRVLVAFQVSSSFLIDSVRVIKSLQPQLDSIPVKCLLSHRSENQAALKKADISNRSFIISVTFRLD